MKDINRSTHHNSVCTPKTEVTGRRAAFSPYAPGLGSSASGSRLGCRVKRALNSTASPVSTLLCTGSLTTFFFFSSSVWKQKEANSFREKLMLTKKHLEAAGAWTLQTGSSWFCLAVQVKLGLTLGVELRGALTLLPQADQAHHLRSEAGAALPVVVVVVVSPQRADLATDARRLGDGGSCRWPAEGGEQSEPSCPGGGMNQVVVGSQQHRGGGQDVQRRTMSSLVGGLLGRLGRCLLSLLHRVALLQNGSAPHYFL